MSVRASTCCARACSGRHVGGGTHHDSRVGLHVSTRRRLTIQELRRSTAGQFRQAKIQDLRDAVAAEDDVLRLDVPMHDAAGVCSRQRTCDLDRHIQDFCRRHRLRAQPFPQGCAFDELGRDERRGAGLIDLVDGDDVRMVQARCCPGFLCETPHAVGIGSNLVGQNLQGDLAIEPGVLRQVHFTHTAGAQSGARLDSGRAWCRI